MTTSNDLYFLNDSPERADAGKAGIGALLAKAYADTVSDVVRGVLLAFLHTRGQNSPAAWRANTSGVAAVRSIAGSTVEYACTLSW